MAPRVQANTHMTLANQIVLVTGASRGIGQSIARTLGAHGAIMIGTATSADGADAISEYFAKQDIKGTGMQLDVRESANIETVIGNINAQFGAVGILVNNAGITRDSLLMRMKDADWDAVMSTNLSAVYRLCKACLRGMMRARMGRIVNIASVVGITGNAGQANYAAAKAGIMGFSKSLARETGGRGITVNTVAPGFIDTDMTRAMPEAQRNALQTQIPLGRLGDVDDVAQAVLFLASPAAAYITGETLNVNGGLYMP